MSKSNSNKFNQLTNMPTNHYYHNMVGYKNYIYSISGFKSKKVEKYNLIENQWISYLIWNLRELILIH